MMKGQLAGLMKQAQQMQENMKQAAGAARDDRGRGPVGRRPGQGGDDLPARRQAGDHRSEPAGRRQGDAGGSGRRRLQRCRAPGREHDQEKMGSIDRRHAVPPGFKLPF